MTRLMGGDDRVAGFVGGNTETGALIRSLDWSTTPIGPIETWSPSLRMMVSFLLANRFPLLLWWGPDYISIYNDAYRPVLGTKHPKAMGQPVRECWSEIWHILQPLIDTPFNGGPATWMDDFLLEINRHGFLEETHFTVAYSPVPDETAPHGIGGVLATVNEITEQIIGERRVAVLRDLGTRAGEAKTAEEACEICTEMLAKHPKDIPFALLYLIEVGNKQARLVSSTGVSVDEVISPQTIELDEEVDNDAGWPVAEAIRTQTMVTVEDLACRFPNVPPGPWADPPASAVVIPVKSNKTDQLAAVFVAGVSSRLRLNEPYCSFLQLATSQIATAIATARAYEEERRRAEALAEIDRAKTKFFSNVSHEFRTPLTLMLAPLEDVLNSASVASLSEVQRQQLRVAHRNGLRLLKLVNTLLDFSRIEAGRTQARYLPTDLAILTADFASGFRSVVERAGLFLEIDCEPLPATVYVDHEMWEKVVLNLLSNAFKFTFTGGITVTVAALADSAVLTVRDTGVGIPRHQLPCLFERFHRIEGQKSRSFEGSGIGLALVQELVQLHGGTIQVESEPDVGTAFSITVPFGTAHLPPDRIEAERTLASTATRAEAFAAEALCWLPDTDARPLDAAAEAPSDVSEPSGRQRPRVLLADDNADMRDYVRHLLGRHFEVTAVTDGQAALTAAKSTRPDLLLTDVMMPGLDGFGLLRQIRADRALRDLPVILVSARAGDEAREEGLNAGADDYLTKPFSARELVARIRTNLSMAQVRRGAAETLRRLNQQLEARVIEEVMAREQIQAQLTHAQRMEALGQLAGGIAHDFNNVLQTVLSALTLIQRRADDAEQVRELARLASESTERGAGITGRLLAFARRSELRSEPVEAGALLENLAEILGPTLGPGIAVRIHSTGEAPSLLADKAQLEAVLVNLAVNARDAMPGGGTLTISVSLETVTTAQHPAELSVGTYVRLDMTDTGVGMDATTLVRATEPFFTTKPLGQGTGLGLSMARGFTQQSGGNLAIQSALGQGTTVTLWFPLGPPGARERGTTTRQLSTMPLAATPARVLLVDDDAAVREVLAREMTELGYQVMQASDALAALARLDAGEKVHLLVTDFSMPGMNGLLLTREARLRRPGLPVLLLTGYADKNIPSDIQDKTTVLLCKPVSGYELANRAAALLTRESTGLTMGARPPAAPSLRATPEVYGPTGDPAEVVPIRRN
jgi:signal transduction histidine kinase